MRHTTGDLCGELGKVQRLFAPETNEEDMLGAAQDIEQADGESNAPAP